MPDMGVPARVDILLMELATQSATGCLTLTDRDGEQAVVWFRSGLVYAVSVPGRRPLLGVRLMSSGSLTPEALAEALEVQRTELQGWRLGELLVHLNFVERSVVESFVSEQVRDQVADLLHWKIIETRFANGRRTRMDIAPPMEVVDLVTHAQEREARWNEILPFIGGPDAVPILSTSPDPANDVVLGPYDWALLCKVDGVRTIADLGDDCGFTIFEAGMTVLGLLDAGLVDIATDEDFGPDDWAGMREREVDPVATSVARVAAALADMGLTDPADTVGTRTWDIRSDSTPASPFSVGPAAEETTLAEIVSLDAERASRDDADRLEAERAEAERVEAERVETERVETERVETERAEAERAEAERVEAERAEAERVEAERVAAEEAEIARLEAEEARKAADAEARRQRQKERRAELKKQGLLLTGKAKKEAERLAAVREQFLKSSGAGAAAAGAGGDDEGAAGGEKRPKKAVYEKKKKGPGKGPSLSSAPSSVPSEAAEVAAEEEEAAAAAAAAAAANETAEAAASAAEAAAAASSAAAAAEEEPPKPESEEEDAADAWDELDLDEVVLPVKKSKIDD